VLIVSMAMHGPGLVNLRGMHASLWNAVTGERLHAFDGGVRLAIPSPDGRHLLLAGESVRLVDAWTYEPVWQSGLPGTATAGAFSRDGQLVSIMCDQGHILVYSVNDASERFRRQTDPGGRPSVAFSPDGARLLSSGKGIQLWDLTTGTQILNLAQEGSIILAAFANRSQHIFAVSDSGPARLWPVDPLKAALVMKSRELTQDERNTHGVDSVSE
jgi:WD40 repeat protein